MSQVTPIFNWPMLVEGQELPEATHNDTLLRAEALLHNAVIDRDLTTPPTSVANGYLYIVGSGASGAWLGKDNQFALYADGWKFIPPALHTRAFIRDENVIVAWSGTAWVIIWGMKRLAADFPSTSTSPADVTGMQFAVEASREYVIAVDGWQTSNADSTGHLLAINGPASPSSVHGYHDFVVSSGNFSSRAHNGYDGAGVSGGASPNSVSAGSYTGGRWHFSNGSNAGTLSLRWATEAGSNEARLKAGACMQFWRGNLLT